MSPLDDSEPLFAFAGIWTAWSGVRKVKEGPVDVELYGFLTTQPNAVVKPIHEKAMPVILRSQDEIDTWLSAPVEAALKLQRPLPDDVLKIVATTEKERNTPAAVFEAKAQGPAVAVVLTQRTVGRVLRSESSGVVNLTRNTAFYSSSGKSWRKQINDLWRRKSGWRLSRERYTALS